MACFHCECKRPKDEYTDNQMQERQFTPRTRIDNNSPTRKEVSDSWNFDFDENESDGAEVSAFEYADSRKLDEEYTTRSQGIPFQNRRPVRPQESEYADSGHKRPGVGFDDFDDEEDDDDDVNSYELDTNNRSPNTSSVNFSDLDVDSDSGSDSDPKGARNWNARRKHDGVDFNSDEDLPVHPNWKSSHVANSRNGSRRKMVTKFGSDEDSDFISGDEDLSDDDFPPKRKGARNTRSNDYGKVKDEFSNERDRPRGRKGIPDRKQSPFSKIAGPRSNRGRGSRDFESRRTENFGDKENRRSNRAAPGGSSGGCGGGDSYMDHERFSRPRVNVR